MKHFSVKYYMCTVSSHKEMTYLCENVLGVNTSVERWLGHVDPTGQGGARFLSKVTLLGTVPTSWWCHPAACACCQTHRCNDISLFYFLFLWLPLNLNISLNTCLLFDFSYKLLIHILCLFFFLLELISYSC